MPRTKERARPRPPHFVYEWRKERQLTQAQLAERAGTTHGTISRIETGDILLTQEMILQLAAALRIGAGDLFRSPVDHTGAWALADKISRLSDEQRETASRLIEALAARRQQN